MITNNRIKNFIAPGGFVGAVLLASLLMPAVARAASFTWDGSQNTSWSEKKNWSGGAAPTSSTATDIIFGTGTAGNTTNDQNIGTPFILNSLIFSNAASAYMLTGDQIRFGGTSAKLVQNSASAQVISNALDLNVATTISGAGAGNLTLAGVISGAGNLTNSFGRLILTTNNTYTGATIINSGGVITILHASALGNVSAGTTVNSGGALQIQGGITTAAEPLTLNGTGVAAGGALRSVSGNNTFAGAITLGSAARINSDAGTFTLSSSSSISGAAGVTFGGAGNILISTALVGTKPVTKDGAGKLILTATNTYSGATTISAGTLQVGNGATFGTLGIGTVTNNALLAFNRTDMFTVNNDIVGTGNLLQQTGTLILSGSNTYSGVTTINNGSVLWVDNGGITGTLGTGNITNNGSLVFRRLDTLTVGNLIAGTGNLEKHIASGTVILSATNNTYTGTTLINAGTFSIASIKNVGAGASSLGAPVTAGNGIISLGSASSGINIPILLYTGPGDTTDRALNIGGAGNPMITQNGTGLLKFTSDLTVSFDGDHVLTFNGTGVGEFAGVIPNAATEQTRLVKDGPGSWILSGINTYTGSTRIDQGQLVLARDIGLTNSTITLVADGGLLFSGHTAFLVGGLSGNGNFGLTNTSGAAIALSVGNNHANTTYRGSMSGSGSLVKVGTGRLTLTNANTYTGITSINEGTLALSGSAVLTNTSAFNVAAGATLDVTGLGAGLTLASSQTLEGNGTILGDLTIGNGALLSPGNSLGVLTFDANLTLAGTATTLMQLDTGDALSNDFLQITGLVTYGGSLTVVNIGGSLTSGDTFNLFDFGSQTGLFNDLILPSLDSGLTWDTSRLYAFGELSVAVVPEPSALALVGGGLALLLALRRKRQSSL